jgi:hypothetical protein
MNKPVQIKKDWITSSTYQDCLEETVSKRSKLNTNNSYIILNANSVKQGIDPKIIDQFNRGIKYGVTDRTCL